MSSFFLADIASCDEYAALRDEDRFREQRNNIERLWKRYLPHADPHFQIEAPENLWVRFWEMYLFTSLEDMGMACTSAASGPDVRVGNESCTVWFEAIAPDAGSGADRVPPLPTDRAVAVPGDQILLRYRFAFDEKSKKYRKYVDNGTVSATDAMVIAINGARVPFSGVDEMVPHQFSLPRIIQALLPFGPAFLEIDASNSATIGSGFTRRDKVLKMNASPVSTMVFQMPDYAHISAVLFSLVTPRMYPERVGDDFILVHNPRAVVPLRRGILSRGVEYWVDDNHLAWKDSRQGEG